MDYEREITLLAAEMLALQQVLSAVLYELKSADAGLAAAISRGFDHAANQVEDLAIQAGPAVPPEHLVKSSPHCRGPAHRSVGPPWQAYRHRLTATG